MTLYDTILIDDVDVKSLPGVTLAQDGYTASWTVPTTRGDRATYAGIDGEADSDLPVAALIVPVSVWVHSSNQLEQNDRIDAVRAWAKPRRAVTLTRRVAHAGGNQQHTGLARLDGAVGIERQGPTLARLAVQFRVAAGNLFGPSLTIAGAGPITVVGTTPTRAITLTLAAGTSNPAVANTMTGHSFRFVGTVPAGGVTVDIAARRATRVTGGADTTSSLRWGKADLLLLIPGTNTLTVSAGSIAGTYLPAYL
ncbi:MAG: hypothetical protein QM662_18625 [Gordonia sp. (in: high G+C Gram-positive bacteria)]